MRTRHRRQAPVGVRRSSWQSVGRCTPAARSASASDGASGRVTGSPLSTTCGMLRSMRASGVPPGNFSIVGKSSQHGGLIGRLKAVLRASLAGISLAALTRVSVSFRVAIVLAALLSAPGLLCEAVQRDRHSEGCAALLRADR